MNWWIHALLILGFLILIPKSKHLHLVLSPINIFFKPILMPDHKPVPIDMEGDEEELENLLGNLDKLSKNHTLDFFSCDILNWIFITSESNYFRLRSLKKGQKKCPKTPKNNAKMVPNHFGMIWGRCCIILG